MLFRPKTFSILCVLLATLSYAQNKVQVTMDLNTIKNDQVTVTVKVPSSKAKTLLYSVPKIIPGTYSEDDYGKFIEDFKAFDAKGKSLTVTK